MPESPITAEFFQKRLARLCLTGGIIPLPRSTKDRQILFKSMLLLFKPGVEYSEARVNEVLERWLVEVCPNLDCDHVTLRRCLVDHGYLVRPSDGSRYKVGGDGGHFEGGVDQLDPAEVIRQAQASEAARKVRYTRSKGSS